MAISKKMINRTPEQKRFKDKIAVDMRMPTTEERDSAKKWTYSNFHTKETASSKSREDHSNKRIYNLRPASRLDLSNPTSQLSFHKHTQSSEQVRQGHKLD